MFEKIEPKTLEGNVFSRIGTQWMLITAGTKDCCNTMTASWGGMGIMWGKNVVSVYIRPQRYTKEFVDANELFTLSFYDESYRKALNICGSKSGKDCDKEAEAGLTPYYTDGTTAFEEANMILVCKKKYHQDMSSEHFDEKENDSRCYPGKDYHTMYMAEILKVLVKEA